MKKKLINLLKKRNSAFGLLMILIVSIPLAVFLAQSPQPQPHAQQVPQCSGSCLPNTCSLYNSPNIVSIHGTCNYGGYCCGKIQTQGPTVVAPTNSLGLCAACIPAQHQCQSQYSCRNEATDLQDNNKCTIYSGTQGTPCNYDACQRCNNGLTCEDSNGNAARVGTCQLAHSPQNPTVTPSPTTSGPTYTYIGPTCNGSTFSGCHRSDQTAACSDFGNNSNGLWQACHDVCAMSDPSAYCLPNLCQSCVPGSGSCGASLSCRNQTFDTGDNNKCTYYNGNQGAYCNYDKCLRCHDGFTCKDSSGNAARLGTCQP